MYVFLSLSVSFCPFLSDVLLESWALYGVQPHQKKGTKCGVEWVVFIIGRRSGSGIQVKALFNKPLLL